MTGRSRSACPIAHTASRLCERLRRQASTRSWWDGRCATSSGRVVSSVSMPELRPDQQICRYGLKRAYILHDVIAWKQSVWDRYRLSTEEESFVKVCLSSRSANTKRIDLSTTPLHAIFVIHDNGMDWGMATQIITELLGSDNGIMGTRRDRQFGRADGLDLPLVLTNPDVVWGS